MVEMKPLQRSLAGRDWDDVRGRGGVWCATPSLSGFQADDRVHRIAVLPTIHPACSALRGRGTVAW
jgi:hypothetical protein